MTNGNLAEPLNLLLLLVLSEFRKRLCRRFFWSGPEVTNGIAADPLVSGPASIVPAPTVLDWWRTALGWKSLSVGWCVGRSPQLSVWAGMDFFRVQVG